MATIAKQALLEVARAKVYKWANMVANDIGEAVNCPIWSDKTVQVVGTFGANGAVAIKGSIQVTANDYASINDPQGTAISVANANELVALQENAYWVRPQVTGDANTALDVYLMVVD